MWMNGRKEEGTKCKALGNKNVLLFFPMQNWLWACTLLLMCSLIITNGDSGLHDYNNVAKELWSSDKFY
jgi:hypothetical protein